MNFSSEFFVKLRSLLLTALMRVPSTASSSRPKRLSSRHSKLVPRVIAEAGEKAARRFLEFFAATIRNKNTRQAYYHAVVRFFEWCDRHKIGEIADIEPLHVAAYIEALGKDFEKPTAEDFEYRWSAD
jgi:hypothetical protein